MRDKKASFGFVINEGDHPSLTVFNDGEEIPYTGDWEDDESMGEFVFNSFFAILDEISGDNYEDYVDRGLPMVWFFVKGEEFEDPASLGPTLEIARKVAAEFKDKASFVYLDFDVFEGYRQSLGVRDEAPGIFMQNLATGKNYVYPADDASVKDVKAFVSSVLSGTAKPFIKSEPVPEFNDQPVTVVVATNFEEIVMDETKDVLVEFYAPWCGHCKSLAPIYEELGHHFEFNDKYVIAKVDATANDLPDGVEIQGFPTTMMFRSGAKDTPEEYRGSRVNLFLNLMTNR